MNPMNAINPVRSRLPLLYRHKGLWRGRYWFVDPDFRLIDSYAFEIECSFPDDEAGVHYRQTSHYRWDDGRTQAVVFEARLQGDRLCWDNGRIAGRMWAVDDETLYLRFRFHDRPAVHVTEMIQLSPCGQHRARTWHWFRDQRLFQRTLVKEARVSYAEDRPCPNPC